MNHPLVARVDGGALSEERRMPRRKTEKAVEIAETKWDKDGARADQDYYHVAGGKNPGAIRPSSAASACRPSLACGRDAACSCLAPPAAAVAYS
jgi:hypothetical protein